jgi:hypothetical protein
VGYLKRELSSEGQQELLGLIESFRQELVPLIVPITLLKHHLNRCLVPPALRSTASRAVAPTEEKPGEWVHQQDSLNPCPKELMLRKHALGLLDT